MSCSPQGYRTTVGRQSSIAKLPALMFPMRLLVPVVGGKFDKQLLNNMKADLEKSDSEFVIRPLCFSQGAAGRPVVEAL